MAGAQRLHESTRRRTRRTARSWYSRPYSPKLLEVEFVELRVDGVLGSSKPPMHLARDLAVKCGTCSGTRNGRPVMGLSSSAVKAGAGRGAVGSSDIRYAEHTMIATTGRRVRTVHSSARSVCGRGRKADGQGDLGQSDRTQILRRGLPASTFRSMCPRPTSGYHPGSPTEGG